MKYKNLILTTLCMVLFNSNSYGANIVYPKSDNVVINANTTFFIGSEDPQKTLKINSENVEIHPSGGFYHVVNLVEGENQFTIDNGVEVKVYTIIKPSKKITPEFFKIMFAEPIMYTVSTDGAPLRSTPFDGGINRLQHLEKGIPLKIIGEYGNFFKVQLARDDYAWIGKNFVQINKSYDYSPAKMTNYTLVENEQKRTYTIKLDKKVPYILSEITGLVPDDDDGNYTEKNNTLNLVIYNVDGFAENKFELNIKPTGRMIGYKSYYNQNNELVIEIRNFPKIDSKNPLKGISITLDPGHGGDEYGAIGCLGDKEKDINLAISLKLKDYLQKSGANVFMVREDDRYVDLYDRVKFSQDHSTDIFISIHNNALPDDLAALRSSGSSIFYFYPQSQELATKLLMAITKDLPMDDDRVRQASFAVVRNTESQSVLVEFGYLINPVDNALLITSDFQDMAAQSILHGLENYLNDK